MWPFSKRAPSRVSDGSSVLAAIHAANPDPRQGAYLPLVSAEEARRLWRSSDLGARVVETLPGDMFRRGFSFAPAKTDAALTEQVDTWLEEISLVDRFRRACEYQRALGGGAIWVVTNDGRDQSAPFGTATGTFAALHTFAADELTPIAIRTDPFDPRWGEPSMWRLHPRRGGTIEVHDSRLIRLVGRRVSSSEEPGQLPGWGDSVFTAFRPVMCGFDRLWRDIGSLVERSGQGVYSMEGLAELLAQDQDDLVRARMAMVDQMRSAYKSIVLDSADSFEWHATELGGGALPAILDRYAVRLAAAAEMQVTQLFGQSPAGMNATGESDIELIDRRTSDAQSRITSSLEHLIGILLRASNSPTRGREPGVWSVNWKALRPAPDSEVSANRKQDAEADKIRIETGVLTAEEIRESRYGGDRYGADLTLA
jgi:hypothetical protein